MRIVKYILLLFVNFLCYSSASNMVDQKGFSKSISGLPKNMIDTNDTVTYIDSLYFDLNHLVTGDYITLKAKCIKERNQLLDEYTKAVNDSAQRFVLNKGGTLIENILVNEIFPFWYGTPWDFNGFTNTPGKGKIACGYFVSTTLQHIGFNINRYKLAQQNPEHEALSLSITGDVKHFADVTPSELKKQFIENNEKEGIYFVGLDCHVGYLLFRKNELFFIHANYIGNGDVTIELAEKSEAYMSENYYISKITLNAVLVKKWILGEEVLIKIKN